MASDSPRSVNGFMVFLGSVAAFFGVIIVVVGLLALNRGDGGEALEVKRAAQRKETAAKLDKEAQEKLHSTGWVDKAKGIVHLPVADALPIIVADLKAKKPAPSQVKVDAPLPMPPPYDPNAAEPAPLALSSAPQGADTITFVAPATPAPAAAPAPAATPAPAAVTPAPAAPTTPPPAPAPAAPAPTPAAVPAAPAPATPPAPAAPAPATPTNPTENSAPAQ